MSCALSTTIKSGNGDCLKGVMRKMMLALIRENKLRSTFRRGFAATKRIKLYSAFIYIYGLRFIPISSFALLSPINITVRVMTSESSPPSLESLEESLKQAKKAATECILQSSWTLTIPCAIASVPLSIYFKTYSPLVFTAVSASGFDYYRGMQKCKDLTNEVKRIQKEIAIIRIERGLVDVPSNRTLQDHKFRVQYGQSFRKE